MINITSKQQKLPQTSPKRENLPTMYDLPSEEVGEPGLPDQFHPLQAELLEQTFQPRNYSSEQVFSADDTPTKWEVYEQFLQVPYYVVYNREHDYFRAFHLENNRYQELELTNNQLWLEEIELGLGLWQGIHKRFERLWLRFYDDSRNAIPTATERERQRANLAELELQQLRDRLLARGIDPDSI
jgi:Uma2 family endonuclease